MLKPMNKIIRFARKPNNKGSALIISLFVLTILFGLTASFAISSIRELSMTNRFHNSAAAFWSAEAGLSRFLKDPTLLNSGPQTITLGSYSVDLAKTDTSQYRIVTATGSANNVTRQLELRFPATPPGLFDNNISSGGGIILDGAIAGMTVKDKTRISGVYDDQGWFTTANFDDKQENVSTTDTTLLYPDTDSDTDSDFTDFVNYNRRFVDPADPQYTNEYSASEVLHIQSNNTVNIYPSSALVGKKVVFVEGASAGQGDVNVWFDSTWAAEQNLTVISTGSVNYVQPLQNPSANSQLNTISWDNYNEASIFYSSHSGVTYTNKEAYYGSIVSLSKSKGNVIANTGMHLDLIFVWKEFNYDSPIDENGLVPPAFQGLVSGTPSGYKTTPSSWAEL